MKDYATSSDETLLTQLRAGDEDALIALYSRRRNAVYRFAWQMSGSAETAEDVTQEVFLMLINGATAFDAAKGSLVNYLYGAARFQILRRWEKESWFVPFASNAHDDENEAHARTFETSDERVDLFGQAARNQIVARVREAVLTLPPHYREVVILCDLHETDYAAAAEIIGCAIGTVRSRLHRARGLLANKLRSVAAANAPEESEESVAPLQRTAQVWA